MADNHRSPTPVFRPHWFVLVKLLFGALPVAVLLAIVGLFVDGSLELNGLALLALPILPFVRAFWLWQSDYVELRDEARPNRPQHRAVPL